MKTITISNEIQKLADDSVENIKRNAKITVTPYFYFNNSNSPVGSNSFDSSFLESLENGEDLTSEYINNYIN